MTTLAEAHDTLVQALLQKGLQPTPQAVFWLLGLVNGESRFGTTPDWTIPNDANTDENNPGAPAGPAYNWGSLRQIGPNFIWHGDRNADGSAGTFKFARFASPLEGAKAFLNTLCRGEVPSVLTDPDATPTDLASAMYANGYFTGTSGSAQDRINAYASMIGNGALAAQRALGVTPSDLATLIPRASGWVVGLAILVLLGGTVLSQKYPLPRLPTLLRGLIPG